MSRFNDSTSDQVGEYYQAQSWRQQGAKEERERIIALLQERGLKLETEVSDGDGWSLGRHDEIIFVIKLIQGETNE